MIYLPSLEQTASFDVDCQKTFTEFCPFELPVPGGHKIVPALQAQAEWASKRIASKEAHSSKAIWVANDENLPLSKFSADNADVYWPKHAVPGSLGFELLDGLPAVTDYDFVVWKGIELDLHPYGSCFHDLKQRLSTGVIEFLHFHQITTVLVGGLATEYCVKTTAIQLKQAQFDVILNLEATRGLTAVGIQQAVAEMQTCGIQIATSVADFRRS